MSLQSRNHEKRTRLHGLLRVAAYFASLTLVCGVLGVRHARAEYEDQTLRFGRQMLELARASNHEVTKLVFNGQPLHIGSSVSSEPPRNVLERYEAYCKAHRGQADDFTSLLPAGEDRSGEGANDAKAREEAQAKLRSMAPRVDGRADATPQASAIAKAGFVRSGDDAEGAVTCFVKGPKTKPTTAAAVEAFLTTGELGAFGELRYAYASKQQDGQTLILTVWAESSFNLTDMLATDGKDCAGEDFPEVPRVPSSTRIVSAHAEGMPYGVNVYKTKDTPSRIFEFYDQQMRSAGWFSYDPEMTESKHGGSGRAYMKNAVVVTLGTYVDPEGTFVSLGLAGVPKDDTLGRSSVHAERP